MGYASLVEKMEKEMGHEITEIDRPDLWTRAWVDELGQFMNKEVEGISQKIVTKFINFLIYMHTNTIYFI